MYCLQWLLPVLLIPKHYLHPQFILDQALFMWFYIIGFFVERRPCHICSIIFFTALGLICYADLDACIFWPTCTLRNNGEMCDYVYRNEHSDGSNLARTL
ncbi:hypothetical protein PRIPAC_87054 [Pristionchus pacificus]|uniref:Uncharacterized protein n=1 Tax=Pristionchus pacificus TaxID=54126 RepID=A0A2A6CCW8_PRIPA|nr:hypothetical protein PRIPAC_87054 [Pristionchus pacificus]|eukprot:PDM75851.1 hypothetical protein PRIPAC_40230 [Pristionchus pacificus]